MANYQKNNNKNVKSDVTATKQKTYRYKKRKNRSIAKRVVIIVSVMVILMVSVSFVSTINTAENKSIKSANAVTSNVSKTESKTESSKLPAKPKEPTKPQYTFENTFKVNSEKLTSKQKAELNEKLTSEFILLYDMTSDEIIYRKNSEKKLYPASTTKILTSIVACKIISDPKKIITVGDEIELIGEESSIAGLEKGMKLKFETLLDALMLPSGNDAAYTVAVNCARIYKKDQSIPNKDAVKIFMELVNDCAKQLGAKNTHFVTPDGWHDNNHFTTAEDLARFTAYAKTIPLIKKSCAKPYAKWELDDGRILEWENSNKLLLSGTELYSEYCDGMKTGFTDEAGSSVIASATISGHTLIAVVMNGQTLYAKYNDVNYLFDEGFKANDLEYKYGFS